MEWIFTNPVARMATKEKSQYERRTWPELKRLCEEVPEAGIHFQSELPYYSTDLTIKEF